MKFILPIIFSLTLLTGCIKHTPEMDKQLAIEQSLNEESNEEARSCAAGVTVQISAK